MTYSTPAELTIQEDEGGKKYSGTFLIGGRCFRYKVVCTTALSNFEIMPVPSTEEEVRGAFPISVWHGCNEIPLNNLEYGFFYQAIVANLPDMYASGKEKTTVFGRVFIEQQWIDVLSLPKFGCSF